MSELDASISNLIKNLADCEEVKRYKAVCAQLEEFPEKDARLQEFRERNYILHDSGDQTDLFAEEDRLEKEFRDVYEDPISTEYLSAEIAVARLIQTINRKIVKCLKFKDICMDGWEDE